MPRRPRHLEDNVVYHVYNRRTDKQRLFDDDSCYEAFLELLVTAKLRYPIRLHAFCLMPTHWHFAVSAERAMFLSRSVAWISTKHAIRLRRDTNTVGQGHVYQGRFQAIPAEDIVHYVRLIRYIETNPRSAGLVTRAEVWRWSSLASRCAGDFSLIDPGPWSLPPAWTDIVNTPELHVELLPELLGQVATFRPAPVAFH